MITLTKYQPFQFFKEKFNVKKQVRIMFCTKKESYNFTPSDQSQFETAPLEKVANKFSHFNNKAEPARWLTTDNSSSSTDPTH